MAGGSGESVLEPRWDTDGSLYFLSDRAARVSRTATTTGKPYLAWLNANAMLDDMRMRKMAEHIQEGCIRAVRKLAAFLGRSP